MMPLATMFLKVPTPPLPWAAVPDPNMASSLLPRTIKRWSMLFAALGVAIWLTGQLKHALFSIHRPNATETDWHADIFKEWEAFSPPVETQAASSAAPRLPAHSYHRSNGLLTVNPHANHPIFDLVEKAEEAWNLKLQSSSTSLDEAVEEYEQRYNRPPPKGFHHWWDYVEQNNVQLPDEYDQIHRDLEPFWGIDPLDLNVLQAEREAHADTWTIGKVRGGNIRLMNYTLPYEQSQQVSLLKGSIQFTELLQNVSQYIPPFRATFSPHDSPDLWTNFEVKRDHLNAAALGQYIDIADPPEQVNHWLLACSPASLARRAPTDLSRPASPQTEKTFIYDHRLSMDPCGSPNHFVQHGQFLSHGQGPGLKTRMVPAFSFSSTWVSHDITVVNPNDEGRNAPSAEWEEKSDERLLWRGRNTGIWCGDWQRWKESHRQRLIEWGNSDNSTVSVLKPPTSRDTTVSEAEWRKGVLNAEMIDVAFAGNPINCTPENCEELREMFDWKDVQSWAEASKYKYVMDVDGNGWSSRYRRLLQGGSLVFKSSIYPEWYMDRIAPWVHMIPIQVDLSDLYDTLVFFRGDENGKGHHDKMARKIAKAGQQWANEFWRKEDMIAYMFRLFLEYARVMSPDREAMSYSEDDVNDRAW